MSRLSNRDVDALVHDEYEEALAAGEPWAEESLRMRQWIALHGKPVAVEFDDGCKAEGVWEWVGQTGPDFYLVRINNPDGSLVVGTDPRNFTKVGGGRGNQ